MYWTCGQCCVFHMWVVGYNVAITIRTVRTGHVVSGIRSTCVVGFSIVIVLDIQGMW